MRVWMAMGYVTAEFFADLRLMDEDESCDYVFKMDGAAGFFSAAASLLEALTEPFCFMSAESGGLGEGRDAVGSASLPERVSQLEQLMTKLSDNVEYLVGRRTTPRARRRLRRELQ